MTTPTQTEILRLNDAGNTVDEIVAALKGTIGASYVYQVLRRERPKRKRKPRTRTGTLRLRILLAKAQGESDEEIRDHFVDSGECSRQYIYKILAEV